MSFLAPSAALFGLTLAAITALYFLRSRAVQMPVASTLLWQRVVSDRQASVPWQRLRVSWLLVLQLLAAALLVLALVRPAAATRSLGARHTIVVLEAGASMQATDVRPNRFEAARAEARRIIDGIGPSSRLTLIWMGPRPRVLADATGDRSGLLRALARSAPSYGGADLRGALSLAVATAAGRHDTRLVLVGDGITEPLPAALELPFRFEERRVGVSGENLAVAAVTLTEPPGPRQAIVRVENTGRQRQTTSLGLRIDDRLVDARPVELDAGSGRDLVFEVAAGAGHVTASLSPHDLLPADDTAVAIAAPARRYDVVLVTERNLFLERALALRPDLRVRTVARKDYDPAAPADLFVFDGHPPTVLPDRPSWVLAPPAGPTFGAGAEVAPGRLRAANATDALTAGLDLSDVHVARAADLRQSRFGRTLVEGESGPVIAIRDEAPRAVLFGFDLHDSDLPLRLAFPVLIDRLSRELLPAAVPPTPYRPGDPVTLPVVAGTRHVVVTAPDGSTQELTPAGGSVTDARTDVPGLYAVEQQAATGPVRTSFAVQGYSPERSAIAPRPPAAVSGSPAAVGIRRTRRAELWPLAAAGALGVLLAEWLVFHRG